MLAARTWDIDKDGVATCDEWKRYAGDLFTGADANRDGYLSADEYRAMSLIDRLFHTIDFKYFDANGDGRVSRTELVDKPNPAFTRLDKNNDCKLEGTELLQPRPARDDKPSGDRGKRGKRGGGGPPT